MVVDTTTGTSVTGVRSLPYSSELYQHVLVLPKMSVLYFLLTRLTCGVLRGGGDEGRFTPNGGRP